MPLLLTIRCKPSIRFFIAFYRNEKEGDLVTQNQYTAMFS